MLFSESKSISASLFKIKRSSTKNQLWNKVALFSIPALIFLLICYFTSLPFKILRPILFGMNIQVESIRGSLHSGIELHQLSVQTSTRNFSIERLKLQHPSLLPMLFKRKIILEEVVLEKGQYLVKNRHAFNFPKALAEVQELFVKSRPGKKWELVIHNLQFKNVKVKISREWPIFYFDELNIKELHNQGPLSLELLQGQLRVQNFSGGDPFGVQVELYGNAKEGIVLKKWSVDNPTEALDLLPLILYASKHNKLNGEQNLFIDSLNKKIPK